MPTFDKTVSFSINLSRPSLESVTAHWRTQDGSAIAGQDYEATEGDVTFAPGEVTKTVAVPTVMPSGGDRKFFSVVLSSLAGAVADRQASTPAMLVPAGVPPFGPGTRWRSGDDVPDDAIGVNGDYFLRINGDVYGPKAAGSWGEPWTNLNGPSSASAQAAAQSAQGAAGSAQSAAGSAALAGGFKASAEQAAADALQTSQELASSIANAAVPFRTWAAMIAWAATATPDAVAKLLVNDAGHAKGEYLAIGGVPVWQSDLLSGVDARTTRVEGNLPTGQPRHGDTSRRTLIEIGAETDAETWDAAWMAVTGPDAGKFDTTPSQSLADKIGVLLQIADALILTGRFGLTTPRHGVATGVGLLVENGGPEEWWTWRQRRPPEPEAGRMDVALTSDSLLFLRTSAPMPAGSYTAIPVAADLWAKVDGILTRLARRLDQLAPEAAVSVDAECAIGSDMLSQSNGVGGASGVADEPTIPTPPAPNHCFMPVGGQYGGSVFGSLDEISADTVTGIVPAKETGIEGPSTAAMRWLYQRDLADGRNPYVYIGQSHGYGGQFLTTMLPGTNIYKNGQMLRGKSHEFARAYGLKRIWYPAWKLRQGEAERSSVPPATWAGTFRTVRAAKEADIRAETRQSEPVWAIISQLCATPGGVDAHTALGQQMVVANLDGLSPRTTFSAPTYFLQGAYGMGGVHYKSLGDDVLAEQEAKSEYLIREAIIAAIKAGVDPATLTNRQVRTSLRVDIGNIYRVGNVIHLPLLAPLRATDIELDTTTLPPATNYGCFKTAGTSGNVTGSVLSGSSLNADGTGYEWLINLASFAAGQSVTLRWGFTPDMAAGGVVATPDRASAWTNIKARTTLGNYIAVPDLPMDDWLCTGGATITYEGVITQ